MQEFVSRSVFAIALVALVAVPAMASESSSAEETPTPASTPAQQADERFNAGLEDRDAAWRLQKKLVDAPEQQQAKLEKKIRSAYEAAVRDFEGALELAPRHHKALGSLGYALRQLGEYDRALAAYDAALEIDPEYPQAIEYRGEAYLGLNRINDAQNAYRVLTAKSPDLAGELLGAMQSWVEARRADAAGLEPAQVDGFARWVEERQEVAKSSSTYKSRSW